MRQGAKGTQTAWDALRRMRRQGHQTCPGASGLGKHNRLASVGVIHQAREMGLGLVHVDQPLLNQMLIVSHGCNKKFYLV